MKSKAKQLILISTAIILGTYFLFFGLSKAQPFLAPIAIAVLLSLLMIPISAKMESWGLKRGWSALISDLIVLGFFMALFFIVSAQVQSVAKDWPQMKKQLEPKIERVHEFVAEHTPYSREEQRKKIKDQIPGGTSSDKDDETEGASSSSDNAGQGLNAGSVIMNFFSFLGSSLLTLVYIFFFLLYRRKFKKSILKFFAEDKRQEVEKVVMAIGKVSQNYLFGKLILIIFLAILYGVGLSISGVKHALLISILAAVLSLIPYLGNMIGFALAVAMGLFAGGGTNALIGIVVTFTIAQFVESYILEPYVVGDKVDIHPVFTIIAIILGGEVWGVVGMIVAIPIFGIIKVICDNVPVLTPVGYLLGDQKKDEEEDNGFFNKIYQKFKK